MSFFLLLKPTSIGRFNNGCDLVIDITFKYVSNPKPVCLKNTSSLSVISSFPIYVVESSIVGSSSNTFFIFCIKSSFSLLLLYLLVFVFFCSFFFFYYAVLFYIFF